MNRRVFLASLAAAGIQARVSRSLQAESESDVKSDSANESWIKPTIVPLPAAVAGVQNAVIRLDGRWEISTTLADGPDRFDATQWRPVTVPGQANLQGIPIQREQPYLYRKQLSIPADFSGKRIFLRFEGVSGTAEPHIASAPLDLHRGGFTIWNREITEHVRPGSDAELLLRVTDPNPRHWSSGFDYGGICRSVRLFAAPKNCISRLQIDTDLVASYRRGIVRITAAMLFGENASAQIECTVRAPSGREIPNRRSRLRLTQLHPEASVEIAVEDPELWDAEHPRLYLLEARLLENGEQQQVVTRSFGIRKIELQENRVLVNGMPIKLRGGGRFDSDPRLGHTLSDEQCEQEVGLLKEGNLNYIRPACYPATEAYLAACDRMGMYVEGENSVTFTRGSQSDSALEPLFVGQMAEMIEANRNHPCILHWSLGNESSYGANIAKTFEYTKAVDPSRPILFSWSHGIPADKALPYTLFSFHYPTWSQDLGKPDVAVFNGKLQRSIPAMPVLHDEFAHGPCYDHEELLRDPNVHNFWGESIQRFWERMFVTDGCLGGSIWAVVDDLGHPPHVYAWGMLDLWRRKKPEYWLMLKAYSPIRVDDRAIPDPGIGKPLRIPIKNWHDHTHLHEIEVAWSVGAEQGRQAGPKVAPHGEGWLELPPRKWKPGEILELRFTQAGREIDRYALPVGAATVHTATAASQPRATVSEDKDAYTARCGDVVYKLDKTTGTIEGSLAGMPALLAGPSFHLIGATLDAWQLQRLEVEEQAGEVRARMTGSHGSVVVRHEVALAGDGTMRCRYTLVQFPLQAPETRTTPWDHTSAGGFAEVGLSFLLTPGVDSLRWVKKGLYSVYPEDHIGRTTGTALRFGPEPQPADARPAHPWFQDERWQGELGAANLRGLGTNDFRSMKEYIREAVIWDSRQNVAVRVTSPERDAVRLDVSDPGVEKGVRLIVNNEWNYPQLGLGNYMKPPVVLSSGYSQEVSLKLEARQLLG